MVMVTGALPRLLFDLCATQPNQAAFHGGGEYAKAVFHALVAARSKTFPISAFYNPERPLDGGIWALCDVHKIELLPVDGTVNAVRELLNRKQFTHFFSALPYQYGSLDVSGVEATWVIHGLRELECAKDVFESKYIRTVGEVKNLVRKRLEAARQRHLARQQFQSLLPQAGDTQEVIVPSLHTKYSIVREFDDIDPQRIRVIASPLKALEPPSSLGDATPLLNNLGVEPGRFFLITSAGRWIKNAYRAVRAFDELASSEQLNGYKLVVIGGDNLPLARWRLERPSQVVVQGYLEDNELSLLYREAFAFVYPTLNEGFGYPPIESMHYGTPVVAAATTSVPEVCRDAALYFNPLDVEELKNRLLMLQNEPVLYNRLKDKGHVRAQQLMSAQPQALNEILERALR